MFRSLHRWAFALLVPVAVARADSDGYYCVGAGFIAVEFRAFNTPGLHAAHVLKIARFDGMGPRWDGEVALDDFQTHTLSCGAATVLIEGAGRGLISYVIRLDSGGPPRIVRHTVDRHYVFNTFPEAPDNIGNWAHEGVRELPNRGAFPRYQLRVTQRSERRDKAIAHTMTSVLEEVDASGVVLRQLLINTGTLVETVD